jgi:hypothetical protein
MKKIKIAYSDFWYPFDPKNTFYNELLKFLGYEVEIVDLKQSPNILFYSCYTHDHRMVDRSRTKKIFVTGENVRPNFNECDYSISFDFPDYGGKNIRLPLWLFQIDWFNKENYTNPEYVIPQDKLYENDWMKKQKTKFCCIVFNTYSHYRAEMIEKLSRYKKVDCYGKPFGNWFYGEKNKINVLSDYKFNICFENSLYPGYYTEKPIHSKTAGCIPIYWADKYCYNDFNQGSFLNLNDCNNSVDLLIQKIIEMDSNQTRYENMKNTSLYKNKPSIDYVINRMKQILCEMQL